MSASLSEASALVRLVAGRRSDDPRSVKQAIDRAARRLGWSRTRTKDIWYRHARRVDAEELDALRAVAREQEADAANILAELAAMVQRAERLLAQSKDADRRGHR